MKIKIFFVFDLNLPLTSNSSPLMTILKPTTNNECSLVESIIPRFGLEFESNYKSIPKSKQVQNSNLFLLNEVVENYESAYSALEPVVQSLPITLRKGTRECTKRPLYPASHSASFQRFQ